MRPTRLLAACAAGALALLLMGITACGAARTLRMTYVKKDSSEQRMLQDQQELEKTRGVTQVIATIDAQNSISMQLFVDEDDSVEGRQKALELGYAQVRN